MSALFPQTAREYAVARIARALIAELPEELPEELETRAAAIVATADHLGIPFAATLRWTHYRAPGQEKTLSEFRAWARAYAEDMKRLPAIDLEGPVSDGPPRPAWEPAYCGHCREVILTEAAAAAHICHLICPQCHANSAQRVSGRWICSHCGEVEV